MYETIVILSTICNIIIGHSIWDWPPPEEDRIKHLPGLEDEPSFAQFSGYLQGSTPNYQLHYWFIEAESDSEYAPLVLWLNGGPGCSSLEGLLTENGPFTVTKDKRLVYNPYSWNKFANMLYLESPAGVGFSYAADGNVTTDDDLTSLNSLHALLNFLEKFPGFKHRDFYITGESYAGVYVPTLAQRVIKANYSGLNLKGIAVGNGLTSYFLNDNSLMYFINYHGLADENSWNDALRSCCGSQCANKCMFTNGSTFACQNSVDQIQKILDGLNIYNLYSKCAGGVPTFLEKVTRFLPWTAPKRSVRPEKANLFRDNQIVQLHRSRRPVADKLVIPCVDDSLIYNYLNQKNVQHELHIKAEFGSEWDVCSESVINQYGRTYQDLSEHYMDVLRAGIPVMLFAGDIDMACNYLGILWFVDKLDLKLKAPMKTWLFKDSDGTEQIGGVHKTMVLQSNNASLWYVTVRGSGHMVPTDKPIGAYHIITHFIQKKEL